MDTAAQVIVTIDKPMRAVDMIAQMEATADFDGINGLQIADIFAFLNAWFAGCP